MSPPENIAKIIALRQTGLKRREIARGWACRRGLVPRFGHSPDFEGSREVWTEPKKGGGRPRRVQRRGPISLQPYGGHTWARSGHRDRVPTTYKRLGGVRYLMGAYDYYHKRFRGYLSSSKSGAGNVQFLRWVRGKYPSGGRIYLIQDNLSTHTTPAAVAEAGRLRITFAPTPTNASHLNPIETRFRTIRRWAFTGINYTDWARRARHSGSRSDGLIGSTV